MGAAAEFKRPIGALVLLEIFFDWKSRAHSSPFDGIVVGVGGERSCSYAIADDGAWSVLCCNPWKPLMKIKRIAPLIDFLLGTAAICFLPFFLGIVRIPKLFH